MEKLSQNIQKKGSFYAHFEEFSYFTQNLEILTSDWKWLIIKTSCMKVFISLPCIFAYSCKVNNTKNGCLCCWQTMLVYSIHDSFKGHLCCIYRMPTNKSSMTAFRVVTSLVQMSVTPICNSWHYQFQLVDSCP